MAIFRWGQHWDPLQDLEREVDRLLQGVSLSLHGVRFGRRFPLLNLLETVDGYLLTAEIPGVDPSQIEVTISGGYLSIRGVRPVPEEARSDSFRRQERFNGPWQRKVQLPERVDEDRMKAEYSAGVLRISLPRTVSTPPRQILVSGDNHE